jgi:amidase
MTPDLSSLKLALKTMLDTCPWEDDWETNKMPWSEAEYEQIRSLTSISGRDDGKLCFGIMQWDGNVQPHPPVARALRLVVEALTQQGYEVCYP